MTKRARKDKVFWTKAERDLIVSKAVDTQRSRPDLAGLPLLRAAMLVLPATRRREIAALTQVEWFEPSVKAEGDKRRELQERRGDPTLALIKETALEVHAHREMVARHVGELGAYHQDIRLLVARSIEVLVEIHMELQEMNARIFEALGDRGEASDE